jgi:protein phosphatase
LTVLRGAGATDTGRVRANNQDAFLVDADRRVFAVCDGVGGHQGGEVASATAVQAIRDTYAEQSVAGLVAAIQAANSRISERAAEDPALRGMATTITAVALVDEDGEERIAVANVGDSRGYVLKYGELSQLTEDHSVVEQLFREGRLTREQADMHPQRSQITRALGLDPDVEVDNWQLLPKAADRILLCSDGLTNEVADSRIASTLRRLADPDEAAKELVRLAVDAGGRDNVTVVVVDVVTDDAAAHDASAALAGRRSGIESHTEDETDDELGVDTNRRSTHLRRVRKRGPRQRRFTWRVALFLVVLLAVLAAAGGAVGWYARRTYYVGEDRGQVAIFKGRPGGLLWFDPTVERRTSLAFDDVPDARKDDVKSGHEVADRAAAERYVANLQSEADASRTFATTPNAAPLTTTTAPAPAPPVTQVPPP